MCRELERVQRRATIQLEGSVSGRDSMADEDTERTEQQLRAALERHPGDPFAYCALGAFYRRWHRYTEAIDACTRGLSVDPRCALLHWELALAHHGAGRARHAFASLNRAIELGLDGAARSTADHLLPIWRRAVA
jgi:tetratricopeptide (TPR) repeat protein